MEEIQDKIFSFINWLENEDCDNWLDEHNEDTIADFRGKDNPFSTQIVLRDVRILKIVMIFNEAEIER